MYYHIIKEFHITIRLVESNNIKLNLIFVFELKIIDFN